MDQIKATLPALYFSFLFLTISSTVYSQNFDPGDVIWTIEFEEGVDYTSPTVVDGVAYIADLYTIFAIDITNGDIIWDTELDNPIYESPAVVDGVLYIGDQNRMVYAFDITDGSNIWTQDKYYSISLSRALTTVFGDVVYMSTGSDHNLNNGWLRALEAATGEMIWEYETVLSARENSPVVDNGIVYIGDSSGRLYAADAETGDELWMFNSGHTSINSSATVHDGVVYTVINQVLPDDSYDVPLYDAYFYALDAVTGNEVWAEPIEIYAEHQGASPGSSPTVYDGRLYTGINHSLFSINTATAEIEWEFETGFYISSSPTVADGVVFVGSNDYSIYAIDSETGTENWSVETPYQVRSSPIVVDGVLYTGADLFDAGDSEVIGSNERNGYLYAIEAGVNGSSQDSRIQLGTLNHHFGLNPFFDVTIASTNSTVREGEDLEVDITIRNFGLTDTQTIHLENFSGEIVDQQEVTLDRSESETITLRWETSEGDAAQDKITVRSENQFKTEIVVVMQEKIIGCEDISIPGYYTMNSSVSMNGTCIHITSSFVELDGGMNTITAVGGLNVSGIVIDGGEAGIEHVTVNNIEIEGYGNLSVVNGAIDITNVKNSTFSNVAVRSSYWGIWADRTENMHVENSIFEDHGCCYGIFTEESPGGTYENLEFNNLHYSFWLADNSHNSSITGSEFHSNDYALIFRASNNIEITDNLVVDSQGEFGAPGDFHSELGADNLIVSNLRTAQTEESELVVSFDAKNIQFTSTESPGSHPDYASLQKYFELKFNAGETRMNMDIHYNDVAANSVDEETLGLWWYDEADEEWILVEHAEVNTVNEVLSVELTEEGLYGVFSNNTSFQVEILSTNAPVEVNEVLDVEVLVQNSGNTEGTQDIQLLNFSNELVDSETVTLAAGDETTVSLSWLTEPENTGIGEVTVQSDNTSDSRTVMIIDLDGGILISECVDITVSGTYILEDDLTGVDNCINIQADDVVFDGSSNTLNSTDRGTAIFAEGVSNISIINLTTTNWELGAHLIDVSGALVEELEIIGERSGILLSSVTESTIRNNNLLVNRDGLVLNNQSTHNEVENNTVSFSRYGFILHNSQHNILTGNTSFEYEFFGFRLLSEANENTFSENTALASGDNGETGFFIQTDFNTFSENLSENNEREGFHVSGNHNHFEKNTVKNNLRDGIRIANGDENKMIENIVDGSGANGVWLWTSNNNEFINNEIDASGNDGLRVEGSNNNTIDDNIVLNSGGYGIRVGFNEGVSGNSFSNNRVSESEELDFLTENDSENNPFSFLTMGADESPVQLSFNAKNIGMNRVETAPAANEGLQTTGIYFQLSGADTGSQMEIDIHYDVANIDPEEQELLSLWYFNDSANEWAENGGTTLDVEENTLSAVLTEDNVYALFIDGMSTSILSEETPVAFELLQNYPNPFNPATSIQYALPQPALVRLEVYNLIGRRVALLVDEQKSTGWHEISFDASSLASGVYIYRIQAGSFVETRQMVLVK